MNNITKTKNGYRYEENGWIRVNIYGKPSEIGYAHGYLLAKELQKVLEMLSFSVLNSTGIERDIIADIMYDLYYNRIQEKYPEIIEEIEAICKGAKSQGTNITFKQLFLWNIWYSVDYIMPKLPELINNNVELKHKYGDIFENTNAGKGAREGGARERCTGFIAVGDWTKDGKIVCGHNTFDNFVDAQYCNVMMYIKPTNGNSWIMQTGPGQVSSGTDYYVTSNGFIVTETTIGGFNAFKLLDPIFCRIRKAVQYSKKLDDFVEILKDGNGGDYSNAWLIGDTKNNEIMRIELGLKYVNVERKKNGYFIGFNAPYDLRIRRLECSNTGFQDIRRHQGARHVRLEQLMEEHKGKITVEIGQDIIADHYDVYLNRINLCSRTCCSHYELDPREFISQEGRPIPYQPRGAIDGIVSNSELAKKIGLSARWGTSCGTPFIVKEFIDRNIQWRDHEKYLIDRPFQPWTEFSGLKKIKIKKTRSNKKKNNIKNKTIKK